VDGPDGGGEELLVEDRALFDELARLLLDDLVEAIAGSFAGSTGRRCCSLSQAKSWWTAAW